MSDNNSEQPVDVMPEKVKKEKPAKVKKQKPEKVKKEKPVKVKEPKPEKVKKEKPVKVKEPKPEKVKKEKPVKVKEPKPEKVKKEKPAKVKKEKPVKVKEPKPEKVKKEKPVKVKEPKPEKVKKEKPAKVKKEKAAASDVDKLTEQYAEQSMPASSHIVYKPKDGIVEGDPHFGDPMCYSCCGVHCCVELLAVVAIVLVCTAYGTDGSCCDYCYWPF